MNKKKLLYLLSLLFVLSYGAAWGMEEKRKKRRVVLRTNKLCVDAWMEICDYLKLGDLLNLRTMNTRLYRIVDNYCKQPKWQPLEIKLPEKLFQIQNIDYFKTKLQPLRRLLGPNRQICLNCSHNCITDWQLEIITDLFQNNLQGLNLSCCNQITGADLVYLEKLTQLQQLNLGHWYLSNVELAPLANLTKLRDLNLCGCWGISDEGLKYLANLTNLQYLNLSLCKRITDEGLKYISNLKNLQYLNLCYCFEITDTGLKSLAKLTKLQVLNLNNCKKITDASLAHLAKLPQLQKLSLCVCYRITGDGLVHLANLKQLQQLNLSCWYQMSNLGLAHLANLTQLQQLDLSYCDEITGDGLAHLANLTNLQVLNLAYCRKIKNEAIRKLQRINPKLRIIG